MTINNKHVVDKLTCLQEIKLKIIYNNNIAII